MQGKLDAAIRAYDKAIELDTKLAPAWLGKGCALGRLGKYDEAIQAFDKVIEADPQFDDVWRLKGLVLKLLEKTSDSNAAFTKAKELGQTELLTVKRPLFHPLPDHLIGNFYPVNFIHESFKIRLKADLQLGKTIPL